MNQDRNLFYHHSGIVQIKFYEKKSAFRIKRSNFDYQWFTIFDERKDYSISRTGQLNARNILLLYRFPNIVNWLWNWVRANERNLAYIKNNFIWCRYPLTQYERKISKKTQTQCFKFLSHFVTSQESFYVNSLSEGDYFCVNVGSRLFVNLT